MDSATNFTLESDEFIRLIGPNTAAALGRPVEELAAELELDPDGQIAGAFGSHDTWSGIAVSWPVDGGGARLPVEFSGLRCSTATAISRVTAASASAAIPAG